MTPPTPDPHDVVCAARGDWLQIEMYKGALGDAGIDGKVVGENLEASLGTAIPNSVELWVQRADLARAEEVIREFEADKPKHKG